jgi:hypothetical protein
LLAILNFLRSLGGSVKSDKDVREDIAGRKVEDEEQFSGEEATHGVPRQMSERK